MSTGYEILNTCHKFNVIPHILQFRITNKTLKDSLAYSRCQQLLLNEAIRCKKRHLRQLMFEYDRIKQELQFQLSSLNFMHLSSLLLVSNIIVFVFSLLLIMFHMILIK